MEVRKKTASLIFALLISSKLLILLMARYGILPFSPGIFVMGLIALLLIVYNLFFHGKLYKSVAGFMCYIALFFLFSNVFSDGHVQELTISFFQYCIIGLLVSQIEFDIELVSKIVSYILLIVFYPTYLLVMKDLTQTWQAVVTMEICYALLPVLAMAIIRAVYFRNTRNILTFISFCASLFLLVLVMIKGTRGVLACLLVLVILMVLNSEKRRIKQIKTSRIVLLLIGIVLLVNIDLLLVQLNTFANSIGLSINILEKSVRLLTAGDVSNGRIDHYIIALQDFLQSPVYGNGIGVFYDRYPIMGYPHNIICQVLFEGGLLLGVPIITLIVKAFNSTFFEFIQEKDKRICIIYLFSVAVPAAMLSSELWVYPLLWMMFGCLLSKSYTIVKFRGKGYSR